ncbi:MAG: BlaI/MecI/CopY family transcriptional regulator [Fuerstiella sp.]|nr:BlaI/MecI/CopY family transcriptional regulator [Fuerstiella sp.]MCP4858498.1 BlaI/MecI/CopY family transcriptional regulator [Fuerstiella sp.]
MPPRPGLSKSELEVARVVWLLKDANVRAVYEALSETRDIDFTTVQTYLRRLAEKGYLNVRLEGRSRFYSPKVRPRTVIRETVDDLVERLFGGEAMPLMKHLVEERRFSDGEIEQLRQLINRMEGADDEQ